MHKTVDGVSIDTKNAIKFYREEKKFGAFSNFSPHPVEIKGKRWPTTEHYFQAMKFEGHDYAEEIRTADEWPGTAKHMGRSRDPPLREDWEDVKERIMCEALLAKFTQHLDLRDLLLSTENRLLVEHTSRDKYWGDGGDGTGLNRLGYCLIHTRNVIRQNLNGQQAQN